MRYIYVHRLKLLLVGVLLLMCGKAMGQYDVSFSHYWTMEPYFNPAAVGKLPKINVSAAYALNFAGFENNPKTMYVSGDMPFMLGNVVNGVGLSLLNDQIGLFTHQRLVAQYALKKRLFGGTLSVGVQGGVIMENFDGSELDVETTGDPAFSSSEVKGQALDLAAGIYYIHGPWYVGLSAQHLTAPLIELGETNELQIDRTYYFTGGYNIKLRNPFLTIHPSVRAMTDGVAYRGDITTRLCYTNNKRVMYVGAGWSPTNSVTFFLGGKIQGIELGYSYEFYTSGLSMGYGSHELFVGYQIDVELQKKGKNKHKSVRIL